MAVGGAPLPHRRVHRTVDVLHFFGGRMRVAEAGVHADVRLHAEQLVEDHVVVDPQVVLLHFVPGGVKARGPLVGVADGIPPVPGGDHVPARPAEHRRADLFHLLDQIGAKAIDVVRGHQRHGADVERPFPGSRDFQAGVVGIRAGRETQGKLGVLGSERLDGDRLPVAGIGSPDQADLHLRAGIARQDHAAGVLPPFSQPQARLLDAVRRGGLEFDHRAVLTHAGLLPVHGDELVRAQRVSTGRRWPLPAPREWVRGPARSRRDRKTSGLRASRPKSRPRCWPRSSVKKPYMYGEMGAPVLVASTVIVTCCALDCVREKTDGHCRQENPEESLFAHESPQCDAMHRGKLRGTLGMPAGSIPRNLQLQFSL